jgi:septal ring factor EnvC (AmiA/AmiB activator)
MLRVLSLAMGVLALVGWGSFAYIVKTSAAAQQQLQEQVDQLIAERDQTRAEVKDLKANRDQLVADRIEAQAQLAVAREEIARLQTQLEQLQARAFATGSIGASAPSAKPVRSPTQTKRMSR